MPLLNRGRQCKVVECTTSFSMILCMVNNMPALLLPGLISCCRVPNLSSAVGRQSFFQDGLINLSGMTEQCDASVGSLSYIC